MWSGWTALHLCLCTVSRDPRPATQTTSFSVRAFNLTSSRMYREYDASANHICRSSMSTALISLGSNRTGTWGRSQVTLARACNQLNSRAGSVIRASSNYASAPVGPVRQQQFLNCVVLLETQLPPARLLSLFKILERAAGRRPGTGVRWGPRPLDIDLIDYGGRRNGWHGPQAARNRPGRIPPHLIMPHPQAHVRPFVLVPLLEIEPHWWHPVLRRSGRQLLNGLRHRRVVARA
jgi:2-amino-4-hydroxy-6-hydroxymethyldihydropteridine diphosphokinase